MAISAFPAWLGARGRACVTGQQIKIYLGKGEPSLFVLQECSGVKV